MSDERLPGESGEGDAEPPATPGWAKGLGIALAALVLLVILLMLLSGGQHGPGRHT